MKDTGKQRLLDLRYLRMAAIWAENSYCQRRKVGALVVKEKMIISDGYNGTPSGFENVCEDAHGVTHPYVLHAEANAITNWRAVATTATRPRSTSPPRPASSVPNSSSRLAYGAWSMPSSTGSPTASTCCGAPAWRWSTCPSTSLSNHNM